jgi:aminoglycoside phosphotransferase (APT) family kinase protein
MEPADFANGCGADIARELGAALAVLHDIPRGALAPETLSAGEEQHHRKVRDATIGHLRYRVTTEEFARLTGWWEEFLRGEAANTSIRTLTHGDPWWENLTVESGHLAGILDWEFLAWWDPANDVGVTLQMSETFFGEVLESYRRKSRRVDPTLEVRARQIAAFREFYGVQFAIERNDEAEWTDSLAKLRAGPILRASS